MHLFPTIYVPPERRRRRENDRERGERQGEGSDGGEGDEKEEGEETRGSRGNGKSVSGDPTDLLASLVGNKYGCKLMSGHGA